MQVKIDYFSKLYQIILVETIPIYTYNMNKYNL